MAIDKEPTLFQKELAALINRFGAENGSDTPDFLLAKFLDQCLAAWNEGVTAREQWHGRDVGTWRKTQLGASKP